MLKYSLILALVVLINYTTILSNGQCTDYDSALCQTYASNGLCSLNIFINDALITESCALSCNPQCQSTTTSKISI